MNGRDSELVELRVNCQLQSSELRIGFWMNLRWIEYEIRTKCQWCSFLIEVRFGEIWSQKKKKKFLRSLQCKMVVLLKHRDRTPWAEKAAIAAAAAATACCCHCLLLPAMPGLWGATDYYTLGLGRQVTLRKVPKGFPYAKRRLRKPEALLLSNQGCFSL